MGGARRHKRRAAAALVEDSDVTFKPNARAVRVPRSPVADNAKERVVAEVTGWQRLLRKGDRGRRIALRLHPRNASGVPVAQRTDRMGFDPGECRNQVGFRPQLQDPLGGSIVQTDRQEIHDRKRSGGVILADLRNDRVARSPAIVACERSHVMDRG